MPSNPPAIYTPPSAGSPPAAAGAVFVPPSAGAPPSAPGAIFTPPSGGAPPSAPPAVKANFSAGSPSAPAGIYTPPSAGSPPAAAGAVFTPPSAGSEPEVPRAVFVPPARAAIVVSGVLTRDGATPLVFPVLLRAPDFNGRAAWTNTGGDWAGEEGGNYGYVWNSELFSWELICNSGGLFGFGGRNVPNPLDAAPFEPFGVETGTPSVAYQSITAPAAVAANYSAGSPSSPPAVGNNYTPPSVSAPPAITT